MKNTYSISENVAFVDVKCKDQRFNFAVDLIDLDLVASHPGTYHAARSMKSHYIVFSVNGKQRFLHKMLLGFPDCQVDHEDGDPFNNRRSNLRKISRSGNCLSRHRFHKKVHSVPRGVFWSKAANKWMARVERHGKIVYLGVYSDPEEAGLVVKKAVEEMINKELIS